MPAVRLPPAGVCVLDTVNATSVGVTVKLTAPVISVVADGHRSRPDTHAVFDTTVATHTGFTNPEIVNV